MAAVDYFLKLQGVPGESKDHKHPEEIELESWSWGETNSGSHAIGLGGGSGKVAMNDFHFTMKMNKASPRLFLLCATGEPIPEGKLVCRKAGKEQQEFYVVTFKEILVSSYQSGGSSHGDVVPTDQISLNFAEIKHEYKPQNPNGSLGDVVTAGWNLKENKAL